MTKQTENDDATSSGVDASSSDTAATWQRDVVIASVAGIAAASMMGAATFLIGHVTESEARVLVEAILPTSRFLCSAVMTATATILALMLTLLGISVRSDQELDNVFYLRIKQIAFYNMLVMVVAVCFLVVHCIPITKSDALPSWWYSSIYYSQLVISAVIGGATVSIVVMLYMTLRDLIRILGLRDADQHADDREKPAELPA